MTTPLSNRWDDIQLMAWADGQLPADEAAALEADIARDADLAHRAALMQPTGALVREAYERQLVDEPVPAALRDAVQAMAAQHRARRERTTPQAPKARPSVPGTGGWRDTWRRMFSGLALPAAVAASVVFGGLGFLIGQSTGLPPDDTRLVAGADAPRAVAERLQRLSSGDEERLGGQAMTVLASFRDRQGRLCRDFSLTGEGHQALEGVACRAPRGPWTLDYVARLPAESGFTPAGTSSALDAYLAGIGAGEPLDVEAERSALKAP